MTKYNKNTGTYNAHLFIIFKGGFITESYLLSRSICLVGQGSMAEAEQLQLSGRAFLVCLNYAAEHHELVVGWQGNLHLTEGLHQ